MVHHLSGKRGLWKRIFAVCIALLMICAASVPGLAAETSGEAGESPAPTVTYNFYVEEALYNTQTLKDGEVLTEPAAPVREGFNFQGWYTRASEGEEGDAEFTDFSVRTVTEETTVNLYARWQAIPTPEPAAPEASEAAGTIPQNGANSLESSGTVLNSEEQAGNIQIESEQTGAENTDGTGNSAAGETPDGSSTDTSGENTNSGENAGTDGTQGGETAEKPNETPDGGAATDPDGEQNGEPTENPDGSQEGEDVLNPDGTQNGETTENPDVVQDEGTVNPDENQNEGTEVPDAAQNGAAIIEPDGENLVDMEVSQDGEDKEKKEEAEDSANGIELYGADLPEDENFIVVEKTFSGITEDQIPEDFAIDVSGAGMTETLTTGNADVKDGTTFRWTLEGVGTGSYQVTERNADIEGYTRTTEGEGTVTVTAADINISDSGLINTNKDQTFDVGIHGDTNFLFGASLTSSAGTMIISGSPLSASQRAAVTNYINSNLNGAWKEPVHFYSVSEDGTTYTVDGKTFTYQNGQIHIQATSNWSHVITLQYSVTEANNPEIGITNAYTPNTQNIQVQKHVTGEMGDKQKDFSFTYTIKDANGNDLPGGVYELKDGETATIENVPVGAVINIKETNAGGYETSAVYGGSPITVSGETESAEKVLDQITIVKDQTQIEVTNNKKYIPDTGIYSPVSPYMLILAVVVLGAAGFIIRGCRKYID